MKLFSQKHAGRLAALAVSALPLVGFGCQGSVGGQTLPSAYYLNDDVQYFPAGPEFLLPNEERVLEEYRLEQRATGQQAAGGQRAPAPLP